LILEKKGCLFVKELKEYPLRGTPYYEQGRKWVSPMNFAPEAHDGLPQSVCLYDLTLRDGEQQAGITFLEDERLRIAEGLAEMGVEEIEAGMPVVSATAAHALKRIVDEKFPMKVFAFARAHEKDIGITIDCGCKHITIEYNVNPYTDAGAYGQDQDAVAERCGKAIKMAKEAGLYVNFMGWDFSRAPIELTKQLYDKIFSIARPDGLVIVDTLSVATPFAVEFFIKKFCQWYPDLNINFHTHNDFGTGVGSCLAAARAGAKTLHCSINGIGDRTGNVSLEQLACAFELLCNVKTGIKLEQLTSVCNMVAEMAKFPNPWNKPIVGSGIFGIESGVSTHINKRMGESEFGLDPVSFPFSPATVGGAPQSFVLGKNSGGATIEFFCEKYNIPATKEQQAEINDRIRVEARLLKNVLTEAQFLEIAKKVVGC
jgi:methanogen homocitrate synthase